MPKNPNYQNAIIYKIVCNDYTITNTYVGSTSDLIKRRCQHKSKCNNENDIAYNKYAYQFIRNNGGWDNWTVMKVVDFPCNSRHELETEERRQMTLLHADLNKYVPTQTYKEWTELNSEKLKEQKKQYRETNSEKINEKITCECGKCYTYTNKTRHERSQKHIQFTSNSQPEIIL